MKDLISNDGLYAEALDARERAYAPYSGISVGAALLCGSGKIYTGANIENAAYSPSVCAERVAIFAAISAGEREFLKIAIAGGKAGEAPEASFPPCGVCRQVMAEFCKGDFRVIFERGAEIKFASLLPYGFDGDIIK